MRNLREIPNLRTLAQNYRPDILFLTETLANSQKMEHIHVSLKFDMCLAVDVVGRSGGIVVMWKNSQKCSIMNFSRNFIKGLV